jgi:hypothetical protein
MLTNVKNRQLEVNYKKKIISCLPAIVKQSDDLKAKVDEALISMLDFD